MIKFLNLVIRIIGTFIVLAIIFVGVNMWVVQTTQSNIYKGNDPASLSSDGLVLYFPEEQWDTEMDHTLEYAKQILDGGHIETVYIFGTPKTVFNAEAFLERNNIHVNLVTNTYGFSVYEMVYALGKKLNPGSLIFVDHENRLNRTLYDAKKFDLQVTGFRVEQLKNGSWWDMIYEGITTVKDFCVVNIYRYEPSKLK